jgi:hypothetical protein
MAFLISIWNLVAVAVYALIALFFVYLIYIYNKEESGYWCVEMPDSPKCEIVPSDLTKALKMGLAFSSISAALIFLFEWWIGEPAVGALVAALVLTILFFPDEVADFSGEVVFWVGNFFEKSFRARKQAICLKCQINLQPTGQQRFPSRFFGKRRPEGEEELCCPNCQAIFYRKS